MEDHNNISPSTPRLCAAGCGFYGSEHFLGLCSKCYASKNKTAPTSTSTKTPDAEPNQSTSVDKKTNDTKIDDTQLLPRKHSRPSSILSEDHDQSSPAATSTSPLNSSNSKTASTTTPATTTTTTTTTTTPTTTPAAATTTTPTATAETIIPKSTTPTTDSAGSSSEANTPDESKKPVQTNKGRCFKCRIKVPLAKQTINKCRCEYVFCDSHRFPERHDCEIDYAKIGRDILAKNNPKLRERPKGGTSFQRIDSL